MVPISTIKDTNPIRAACFRPDGEYFAIGTNSKSLRIYSLKDILSLLEGSSLETSMIEPPSVIERKKHHQGSIYCLDWNEKSSIIASGSFDKTIKLISFPDLENRSSRVNEKEISASCLGSERTSLKRARWNHSVDLLQL